MRRKHLLRDAPSSNADQLPATVFVGWYQHIALTPRRLELQRACVRETNRRKLHGPNHDCGIVVVRAARGCGVCEQCGDLGWRAHCGSPWRVVRSRSANPSRIMPQHGMTSTLAWMRSSRLMSSRLQWRATARRAAKREQNVATCPALPTLVRMRSATRILNQLNLRSRRRRPRNLRAR